MRAHALPKLAYAALAGKFRPALAGLIDRLDLNEAGDDRVVAAFFAVSALKRALACAGTELGRAGTHAGWLDQNDAPPPLRAKNCFEPRRSDPAGGFAIRLERKSV